MRSLLPSVCLLVFILMDGYILQLHNVVLDVFVLPVSLVVYVSLEHVGLPLHHVYTHQRVLMWPISFALFKEISCCFVLQLQQCLKPLGNYVTSELVLLPVKWCNSQVRVWPFRNLVEYCLNRLDYDNR